MIDENFGVFENKTSFNNKKNKADFVYIKKNQSYNFLKTDKKESSHFLYKSIQGDFILRAHFTTTNKNSDVKIGWNIRNNLNFNSSNISAFIDEKGNSFLNFNDDKNNQSKKVNIENSVLNVIQLERIGNNYILSIAKFGDPFSTIKIIDKHLFNEVFVGLFITSKNPIEINFTNVRIIKPAKKDFTPYQDYIGSNLEILNIKTGLRKTILHSAHSIQAPNWINTDKEMVYNSNGFLYKFHLKSKEVSQIETGFANQNNNDHVFSFDEKLLGISHHNKDDNRDSSIYIMNPKGEKNPKKITLDKIGNSYLHGISPDNKTLIYTAHRKGKHDIYGIDIDSRKEFQLTDTKDLDDGSEYSPDGKYIYFNSNRTGNMQLWRMDSDGKNPKQLTFDTNYKDWFPHISPNGKWIVFISFPPDISFGDHPFYKQCTLRLMPTDLSSNPKIIAYIYGGQGSINVPSWSKNSKRIAFITNSN